MNRKILLCLIFVMSLSAWSQKKKEIKKYGIKSITTTETQGDKTINDSKVTYNSAGLVVEEVNYNKEGVLKSITRYKYNSKGDALEELEYDDKNILKEKRIYKYNALGEKTEELTQNAEGKQIKRVVYTYDNRGLRIAKSTYDANNALINTKKTVYSTK